MEKEQIIAAMQKQIEDLKRKAEQGSRQLQGEVQELELESLLRTKFPFDVIEPVPRANTAGMWCTVLSARAARPAAPSCGSPSAPKTGATHG